eukprot:TRINITY_DN5071_c0_g1_i2.p1 TRINITY_DN5071_c0_g1~~TRINITY_DN5071_c0_g1_i2.p1  ORF type:complete len:389 (-),score=76.41 TRINITY_DN5071_c0_g1_i2:24-1190(-)
MDEIIKRKKGEMKKILVSALVGVTFIIAVSAVVDRSPILGLKPNCVETFLSSNIYVVRRCDTILIFQYSKEVFGLSRYLEVHKDSDAWCLVEKLFGEICDNEMLYVVGYNHKFEITKYSGCGSWKSACTISLCDDQLCAAKSLVENYKWPALYHTLYVFDKTGNPVFDNNGRYCYFNWKDGGLITSRRQDTKDGCIKFPLQNYHTACDSKDVALAIQTLVGGYPRANCRVDRPLKLVCERHSPSQSISFCEDLIEPEIFQAFTTLATIPQYQLTDCGVSFKIKVCLASGTLDILILDPNDGSYDPFISDIKLSCECAQSLAKVFGICLETDDVYTIKREGEIWKVSSDHIGCREVVYSELNDIENLQGCLTNDQIIKLVGLLPYHGCH